ncbi:hypothetical protein [Litorihabitans aurantiacus]|uniref:hypothetical protein n=1 Tax=Litorihabitans aurantiacus TaxID=1930061 RepID=UPI0024E07442|nr:hypothetical protein [Litorihabitans aurantiacus]
MSAPVAPTVLDAAARAQVRELADRAHAVDGVAPLSEAHLLALRDGDAPQLVHRTDGVLDGAAVRADGSVEIVVDPGARRRGTGTRLLAAAEEAEPGAATGPTGTCRPRGRSRPPSGSHRRASCSCSGGRWASRTPRSPPTRGSTRSRSATAPPPASRTSPRGSP